MAGRENNPEMIDTVCIPTDRYNDLLEKEQVMEAMYSAGVDNWEGMEVVKDILNDEGV